MTQILWRIVFIGVIGLALSRCTTAPVQPGVPGEPPAAGQEHPRPVTMESTCPAPGEFQAVDISGPVTPRFLATMKYLKVFKVCRYYDWEKETIRGKTLLQPELDTLMKEGFSACVVFQHNSQWKNRNGVLLGTFNDKSLDRGTVDAKRSLELAGWRKQPKGSPILFGADFDTSPEQYPFVEYYGTRFCKLIRDAGYTCGVYGSGYVLKRLKDKGIVDFTWISMSTGFRETKTFKDSNQWNMLQFLDRDCGGMNVDFNKINPANPMPFWRVE